MTSRERVLAAVDFNLPPGERVPRQMWTLPWADLVFPGEREKIQALYPDDICMSPAFLATPLKTSGDAYAVGTYVDEWGCVFDNKHAGVIGEVKQPLIEDWDDLSAVHFPEERLSVDIEQVNRFCAEEERFVQAGTYPRPFERLQFLRGTENLLMDIASEEEGLYDFIRKMHEFYTREMELWARTDVDALIMIDDWGTQSNMIINPRTWREVFKPIYKTYANIAHDSGKKIFMHSDGHILEIYPDLIDIGIDALNSQIFCMGLDKLSEYRGKITFWGEMDRQHILPNGTGREVGAAVQQVYEHLFDGGGVIAQCEFGPGANPDNVREHYAAWDRIRGWN
jgi:hypothetical protein